MDGIDKRFRSMYMDIATGNLNPEKKNLMMEAMLMEESLGEGQPWWGHGGWGAPNFERTGVHRKDLLDIMTSFIPAESVRFGKRVESITQREGAVQLIFEDGTMERHAAVIGCDGVRGFSRRVVLGARYPECVEPQYTGMYAYRAVLPMTEAKEILGDLATDAKMYMGGGANLTTYPISKGREMNVVAFKREGGPWKHPVSTHDVPREVMMKDFESNRPDPRLVKLLDVSDAFPEHRIRPRYLLSPSMLNPRAGQFSIIPTLRLITTRWYAYSAMLPMLGPRTRARELANASKTPMFFLVCSEGYTIATSQKYILHHPVVQHSLGQPFKLMMRSAGPVHRSKSRLRIAAAKYTIFLIL
jgi:hypothetical protein